MIKLTVREIAEATAGKLYSKNEGSIIRGLSIDSRSISPGEVFIAVKGQNHDGHDFAWDAAKKGASGLIVEHEIGPDLRQKVDHVLVVEDSRRAMGAIALEIRKKVDVPVICITGTSGKTTLKEMLSCLLSSRYKVLKSKKSYNNIIGLSLTLFDLDPSYDIAVLELGTNRPGEISRLGRIARPSACVIINVGEGHLERLKDTGGVLKEKMSLLDHLSGSGTAFLNKDDLFLSKVSDRPFTVKFFGLSNGSDFHVTGIKKRKEGCSFLLNGREFRLPLEGEHNVSNAAAAIAVAEHYGISERELRQKLEDIVLPDMRLEKVIIGGVMFINDTYNANPPSFECALKVLEGMPAKGGKGVVAGEMLELGEKSAELHEMIGKSIAEKKMDFLVTVGDMAKHIARGAAGSGMDEKMIFCAENQEEAARNISRMAKAGDIVLIKGSRASRMEEVLKCFTISCTH